MIDAGWPASAGSWSAPADSCLNARIVDRMVGAPERLVFEARRFSTRRWCRTRTAAAPSHDGARSNGRRLPAVDRRREGRAPRAARQGRTRLAPDRAKARGKFVTEQAARIATRTGCTVQAARQTVERQCDGVLHPMSCCRSTTMSSPDAPSPTCWQTQTASSAPRSPILLRGWRMAGAKRRSCADLTARSGSTALPMARPGHELKHAASAIEAVLLNTPDDQLVRTFVQLVVAGDLDPSEQQILRDSVAKRSGINKRTIDQSIAKARKERNAKWRQDQDNQQAAERRDPRPRIKVPPGDDPWLTQIAVVEEVQGSSRAAEPPGRDVEGERARLRMRAFPRLHLLSTADNNPPGDPQ